MSGFSTVYVELICHCFIQCSWIFKGFFSLGLAGGVFTLAILRERLGSKRRRRSLGDDIVLRDRQGTCILASPYFDSEHALKHSNIEKMRRNIVRANAQHSQDEKSHAKIKQA